MIQAWGRYALYRWHQRISPPEVRFRLQSIAQLYHRLCRAKGVYLSVERYGAAYAESEWGRTERISLATLMRSASPPWKGQLLYALARQQRAARALELGTHLGLSTLYLAAALPTCELHTVEASAGLAQQAAKHFRLFGVRVQQHVACFEEALQRLPGPWELVYLDGDHRSEALYRYASIVWEKLAPGGVLVCDDIFWSADMYRGWQRVLTLPWQAHSVIGPFGVLQR